MNVTPENISLPRTLFHPSFSFGLRFSLEEETRLDFHSFPDFALYQSSLNSSLNLKILSRNRIEAINLFIELADKNTKKQLESNKKESNFLGFEGKQTTE